MKEWMQASRKECSDLYMHLCPHHTAFSKLYTVLVGWTPWDIQQGDSDEGDDIIDHINSPSSLLLGIQQDSEAVQAYGNFNSKYRNEMHKEVLLSYSKIFISSISQDYPQFL